LLAFVVKACLGGVEGGLELVGAMAGTVEFLLQTVLVGGGRLELLVVEGPLGTLVVEAVDLPAVVAHEGVKVLLSRQGQSHQFLHSPDFA
jgi:hypothetical protein